MEAPNIFFLDAVILTFIVSGCSGVLRTDSEQGRTILRSVRDVGQAEILTVVLKELQELRKSFETERLRVVSADCRSAVVNRSAEKEPAFEQRLTADTLSTERDSEEKIVVLRNGIEPRMALNSTTTGDEAAAGDGKWYYALGGLFFLPFTLGFLFTACGLNCWWREEPLTVKGCRTQV